MSPLANYLKTRGLSQAEFAAQLGMSRGNLSRIINGRQELTPALMRRLHEVSNGDLTPNDLVLVQPEAG